MSDCNHKCSSCNTGGCKDRDMTEKLHPDSKVKKVIAIASGKGGVGKSLITSLLAVLLKRKGFNTAILDGDITGPSIPKVFGVTDKAKGDNNGIMVPNLTSTGIQIMSSNMLLPDSTDPVVWRGSLIANLVKQFYTEVIWDNVDYMFVDMPPGTGDVPLTVYQSLNVSGIIIVTSPQELVSMIVAKAVKMAKKMNIPILGIVENMSYLECDNCHNKMEIFGKSNVENIAKEYNLTVLGKMPLDPRITKLCDMGRIEDVDTNHLNKAVELIENLPMDDYTIAVPVLNGVVDPHLGEAKEIHVYKVVNNSVVDGFRYGLNPTSHEEIIETLKKSNVDVILVEKMSESFMDLMYKNGIKVVTNASGEPLFAVNQFINKNLKITKVANCGCKPKKMVLKK